MIIAEQRAPREALLRAAEVLQRACQAGTEQFVDLTECDDGRTAVLRTGRPEGDGLSSRLPLTVEEAAGVVIGTATTLAALHAAGAVHGGVEVGSIHLAGGSRPIVCGFHHAGWQSEGADPSLDATALARLLPRMLRPPADEPWTRLAGWLRPSRRPDPGAALLRLAHRPWRDVSELAAAVRRAVPGAHLPEPESNTAPALVPPGEDGADIGWRPGRGLAACAVVVLVLLAGAALRAGLEPRSSPSPMRRSSAATPPVTSLCGDHGCRPSTAGGVLEHGDEHWQLGTADDRVVIADWDCDGAPTPALLRPATGEVFLFPAWDEAQAARRLTNRPDAHDIGAGVGSCPPLLVRTEDGWETIAGGAA